MAVKMELTGEQLEEWQTTSAHRREEEWEKLVEWAGSDTASLSSLHVFVLANVLRRPILIFAEPRAQVGSVEQAATPRHNDTHLSAPRLCIKARRI